MYMLIEVEDNKATYVEKLLHDYTFITKTETITDNFGSFLYDLYDSINYVNNTKKGIVIPRDAKEFLNDL